MKIEFTPTCLASALLLASCATHATTPEIRQVSMEEAMAFEEQIIASAQSQPAPPEPEKVYAQPANKKEPCKLPSSKAQLDRKNFRAYWDGDCKNGYAYGLGRDIAISDTHHVEEITIHNGTGDSFGQPTRLIDFVNNTSRYGAYGQTQGDVSGIYESITNDLSGFSVQHQTGRFTKDSASAIQNSPFYPQAVTVNARHGQPTYRFTDLSAIPATSDTPNFVVETVDPTTGKPGGFRMGRFRNGVVRHQKFNAVGNPDELVILPQEYVNLLLTKLADAQSNINKANASVQPAQQMEREYLHMACADGYTIAGVPSKDVAMTKQFCTWRDQWKEPYAMAQAKYEKQMEQARQQVAQQEQLRTQQLSSLQQQIGQQTAANQAAWNAITQSRNNAAQDNIRQPTPVFQPQPLPAMPATSFPSAPGRTTTICRTLSNGTVVCD